MVDHRDIINSQGESYEKKDNKMETDPYSVYFMILVLVVKRR